MIRYDLKCADGHAFEAWFASSAAFDEQVERGLVACAICGGARVEKALMAPRLTKKAAGRAEGPGAGPGGGPGAAPEGGDDAKPMLTGPVPAEIARKLAALRAEIESKSDYVGEAFAAEARRMHSGETPARSIHGLASGAEARSLIEDGVPVAPLPFMPRRDD